MMTTAATLKPYEPQEEVVEEDRARADIYALLAHLFYSPSAAGLFGSIDDAAVIDGSGGKDSRIARAWHALREAAREAEVDAIRQEYESAFITAGRPPVFLYGSFYQAGFLMEKPLVRLREDLDRLGLARREDTGEPEDHISALCDVMRVLVAGTAEIAPATIEVQREFFMRHIAPWYAQLCTAIEDAEQTAFYEKVAAFAREFFDLEVQSLEIT